MWIVQEVVLAKNVIVRSGSREVAWDTLAAALRKRQTHVMDGKVLDFVEEIRILRTSSGLPDKRLLEYALRFRNRVASDPRDKLLGFCWLRRSTASEIPEILENPYQMSASELFAYFATATILRTKSLAILALAEGRAIRATGGWILDWAKMSSEDWKDHDPLTLDEPSRSEYVSMFWIGDLLPSLSTLRGRKYSAAQGQPAMCIEQRESHWESITLTG